jgi:peptidoglycan/LPS O-acetylase OafA/YrhL
VKEYNYTIDILRFFAACVVVLFHFNEPFSGINTIYAQVVKYGWLGVPVFFTISGYCILLSAKHSKTSLDFLMRRIFRIFPAFWFSLTIVAFVVLFQIVFYGQNSVTLLPKTAADIVKTITLLTKPFGTTPTINWVYWSLTVELFFYLVVFVGLAISKKTLYFTIAVTALALVISPNLSIFLFWIPHWFYFSLGSTIFFYREQSYAKLPTFLLIILSLIGLYKFQYPLNATYFVTAVLSSFLIFFSFNFKQNESKLTQLGDLSYSIYLLHVPIGVYIYCNLKTNWILNNSLYSFLFDITGLALISVFSFFVYRYIEKPSISIGKRLSKKIFIKL